MLDKTVPYYEFWMVRPPQQPVPAVTLPEGFRFVFYQEGDEAAWGRIETAVLEFSEVSEALQYFKKTFAPFPEVLSQRMLFVENEAGEKVATCTAWWQETSEQALPLLHWLAVEPAFQRRGLAAALVAKVTELLSMLEPNKTIYLHTQTWSHSAIRLYEKFGYSMSERNIDGSFNEEFHKAQQVIENLR